MMTRRVTARGRVLQYAVLAVFLAIGAAGAFKLADLNGFARSLSTWTLFPESVRRTALYLVPAGELFLASSWAFGPGRRWLLWAGTVTLSSFTLAFVVHALVVGSSGMFMLWKVA